MLNKLLTHLKEKEPKRNIFLTLSTTKFNLLTDIILLYTPSATLTFSEIDCTLKACWFVPANPAVPSGEAKGFARVRLPTH